MNRREFTKLGLAAGAVGGFPLGIVRAAGQTKGGTLNTIIQPEPPILVTALNQQQPTLTLGGKMISNERMREIVSAWLATDLTEDRHRRRVAKIDAIEREYAKPDR